MDAITRYEARKLIRDSGLSEGLIMHSEGVARRAESTCQLLEAHGYTVNTEKVIIASLLHDIGLSRPSSLDHGDSSAGILEEYGLNRVAELVRVHVFPPSLDISLEAKILIYANLTTGPEGEALDPQKKLDFLRQIAYNWEDINERSMAMNALEIQSKVLFEIESIIQMLIKGQ